MSLIKKNTFIALIVLASIYGVLIVRYSYLGPKRNYSDFRVYHATAQRFIEKEDIYDRKDPAITPFKYSPFFAWVISPLGLLNRKSASLVFFTLNFLWLLVFVYYSYQLIAMERKGDKYKAWLVGAGVAFGFRFLLHILESGQVNLLMLASAVTGLYALRRGRSVLGSALLAFSVLTKYVTILFVPYLFFRKQKLRALTVGGFILLFCLLPSLTLGFSKNADYLRSWIPSIVSNSLDRGSWTDYKNLSLPSAVVRLLMKDSPYKGESVCFSLLKFENALKAGMLGCLLYYGAVLWPRRRADGANMAELALLMNALALFNANAWPFNYAILAFSAMALLSHAAISSDRKIRRGLLTGCGIAFILCNLGGESLVGDSFERWSEITSFITWGTMLVSAMLFWVKFNVRPEAEVSTVPAQPQGRSFGDGKRRK